MTGGSAMNAAVRWGGASSHQDWKAGRAGSRMTRHEDDGRPEAGSGRGDKRSRTRVCQGLQ
eukprot:8102216-Pyramimonas_sp.AAC.1